MLKNQRSMLWLVLLMIGLIALQISKGKRAQLNRNEDRTFQGMSSSQPRQETVPGSSSGPGSASNPSPLPSSVDPNRSQISEVQTGWAFFKSKYGEHLVARFSSDHYLTSIQGKSGLGALSGDEFDSKNEAQVKGRATEIVQSLSGLIGERKDWPIQLRDVQVGPVSGQVFFRETYQGLVVKPFGLIKVDLGPKGELLGFYSDYTSQVQAVAPAILSEGEIQERARNVLGLQNRSGTGLSGIRSGEQIIWISGEKARVAYEFFVEGRNLVVDAQTGRTVLFRDRRQY